jgi:prophage antirepressor-like protein
MKGAMSGIAVLQELYQGVDTYDIDGKTYYNARQIGMKLGIGDSAVRKAIRNMDREKSKLVTKSMSSQYSNGNSRIHPESGDRGEYFLRESGVFDLIIQSRTPEAEAITDWICIEVIPSIARTGQYWEPGPPIRFSDALRRFADEIDEREISAKGLLPKPPA